MTEAFSHDDANQLSQPSQGIDKPMRNKGKSARDRQKSSIADPRDYRKSPEKQGHAKLPTRTVAVESPYGPMFGPKGKRINDDRVERVIDTIALMLRAHQIDVRQEAAARKVQDAWALAPGSIRCALAAGEGGGGIKGSPTEKQLWAGRVLNDVDAKLGSIDGAVVLRVCGMGYSIDETARMVFGVPEPQPVKETQSKHVGMRLRMGLTVLANHWHRLPPKAHGLRGGPMTPDARPSAAATPDGISIVQTGRVYTADRPRKAPAGAVNKTG